MRAENVRNTQSGTSRQTLSRESPRRTKAIRLILCIYYGETQELGYGA